MTKQHLIRISPEAKRALALLMASQEKNQQDAASDAILAAWEKEKREVLAKEK